MKKENIFNVYCVIFCAVFCCTAGMKILKRVNLNRVTADLAVEVVCLLHRLCCSGVVHLQHVVPVLKLGFKHLQ